MDRNGGRVELKLIDDRNLEAKKLIEHIIAEHKAEIKQLEASVALKKSQLESLEKL